MASFGLSTHQAILRRLSLPLALFSVMAVSLTASERNPPKPQQVFAPYWTTEPGWHTEFQLRNNLASGSLVITPIVRLWTGQEYPLTPVSISASDVVTVNVNKEVDKIARLSQPATYGSVVFSFSSPNHRNLYAAVMVHEMGQPIGYHFDAFPMDSGYTAGSREGIWWLPRPDVKDSLVIANGSDQSNHGRLSVYDSSGKSWHQDVQLLPKQTLRLMVRDLVTKAGLSGTYGGLKFEVAERAGSIDTVHFLYDETAGFSAMMKMFDHDPAVALEDHLWGGNKVWTIWAPMLALQSPDPALALPPGTELQPKVFVRNTTSQPRTANVSLTWRGDSPPGVLNLPTLQLKPFESRLIDVQALQQGQQIPGNAHWALVKITSPGKPYDIVAVASSYDGTGRYGAQTPFDDQLEDHAAAGQWQVDSTHNSIISVTNGGSKTVAALLTFHYNNGQNHYEVTQSIAPGDQMWLNLGALIHNAVPDRNGKPFPQGVTYGAYDIRQPNGVGNPSLVEAKIIVDKTNGHLAYGCQHCCGYDFPWMVLNPETLPLQAQDDLSVWADGSCDGTEDDITGYFSSWDTTNHSIATMNVQRVTGTGAGSASAFASATINYGNGENKYCPPRLMTPRNTTNVVPKFSIAYSSYIPVDHLVAPSTCVYHLLPYFHIYIGDAGRGSHRTAESILIVPDKNSSSGFWSDVGQTRQYAAYSPKNGNTLSYLDEDGIANDCYLWNYSATADRSTIYYSDSYPYPHQGQMRFWGAVANPLEAYAPITWDMRTVLDTTNPAAPTAYVNYNHTCYPSHQVAVNGQTLYSYRPPSDDPVYIANCLLLQLNKKTGQTSPVQVPTH